MIAHRRSSLFRLAAAAAPAAAVSNPDSYVLAALDAATIAKAPLAALRGRAAKFTKRLELGYRCVGYLDAAGIVRSYVWIAGGGTGPETVPVWRNLRWRLSAGDTYLWDCRTDPAHEGRGLYRCALRAAAAQAAARGSRDVWIESEIGNEASTRGIRAAGFAPAASLEAWHALGVTLWRAGGGLPKPAFAPVRLQEE